MTPARFRAVVWRFYREHGRHDLPWRKTQDPYRILVSEIMLQQTQVERVMPFYRAFISRFPTAGKLAAAPLSEVLMAWQGLGYNRRAKMLHQAAHGLKAVRFGRLAGEKLISALQSLPGVGPYTARAVAAFAFNADVTFVETNIRTLVIHHFFPRREKVSDAEIDAVLVRVLPKSRSREWYSALMDYGAHLKRTGVSHNAKSAGYAKQSKFTGSLREARGAILRELSKGVRAEKRLVGLLGDDRQEQLRAALVALSAEGLIVRNRSGYALQS